MLSLTKLPWLFTRNLFRYSVNNCVLFVVVSAVVFIAHNDGWISLPAQKKDNLI